MSNDAERIREEMGYKVALSIIVDEFKEYIKKIIEIEAGETPRYISPLDIFAVRRYGRTGSVHLVTVKTRSDVGDFNIRLALKFSSSPERTIIEAKNAEKLMRMLMGFPDIGIPRLLFSYPSESLLIYEGLIGETYIESKMSSIEKATLAGKTLAAIQGGGYRNIDYKKYEDLMAFILLRLPIKSSKKEALAKQCSRYINELKKSIGGCNIFGDYHQSNIFFVSMPKKAEFIRGDASGEIKNLEGPLIKTYVIDPEYVTDDGVSCRAEDIGTFFGYQCLQEFENFGTLNFTKKDLEAFLFGYNGLLEQLSGENIFGLYPKGLPVEFHIAYWLFLGVRDLLGRHDLKEIENIVTSRIELAEYLLCNRPLTGIW